jgi:hypothetical protein
VIRVIAFLDRNAGRIILAVLALCLLAWLVSCADSTAPRDGSAQAQAAGAAARADTLTGSADRAAVDAATKQARADELARQAVERPTVERIAAAADARVEAAAAAAVAKALATQAGAATAAAEHAATLARQERDAETAAQDVRSWQRLCRLVGLIGVGAGVLIGGALGWLVRPRTGVLAGLLIAGTGAICHAYGESQAWLPWSVLAAVVLGLATWALAHWHIGRVGHALSRALDMAEADPREGLASEQDDAKAALAQAIKAAGLKPVYDRLRGPDRAWKSVSPLKART